MGQIDEQGQGVRQEQQGRMYVAIAKKVDLDVDVFTGTLLIYLSPTIALFDSSSIQSFIAKTFVDWIGVFVENFIYDLVVSPFAITILTTGLCVGPVAMIILQAD